MGEEWRVTQCRINRCRVSRCRTQSVKINTRTLCFHPMQTFHDIVTSEYTCRD